MYIWQILILWCNVFNTYSVFKFVKPTNILLWTSLILFSDSNLKSNIIIHCHLFFHLLSTQSYQLCTCYSAYYFHKTEGDVDKEYEPRIDQEGIRCNMQTIGKIWRHKKKLVKQQTRWYVHVLVTHKKIHWGA